MRWSRNIFSCSSYLLPASFSWGYSSWLWGQWTSQMSQWSHDTTAAEAIKCVFPCFCFIIVSRLIYSSLAGFLTLFPRLQGLHLLSLAIILPSSILNPYMSFNVIGGFIERESFKSGQGRQGWKHKSQPSGGTSICIILEICGHFLGILMNAPGEGCP